MTYTPHSLLEAAKLVASIAGLDWAHGQRYYRNLQAEPNPWLPKSIGRNIWHAHPHYVARLLIAIAMTDTPDMARAAVDMTLEMTPNARPRTLSETDQSLVELALSQFLIHSDQADTVSHVEFDPMLVSVSIVFKSGKVTHLTTDKYKDGIVGAIYRRGIIPGAVFSGLSRSINWRRYCDDPFGVADIGSDDSDS